ncbi:M50 family metallopeptidase [Amycolatopsis samaneae]|uniref:M50 family metallopeptidase n=1 Tax=Amycolatopsis samaneae TaxID=664691 RepID=A0ABW5GWQ7_9PSEU
MTAAVEPVPAWLVVVVTGVFAAGVSVSSFVRLMTGSRGVLVNLNVLGTVLHEAGHAAAACVTGGGVLQIRITGAESGWTYSWYRTWLSDVVTVAAGYAAPPLAGLGAASLLSRGRAGTLLTITVVAMALILIVTRDVVTLAAVAGIGAAGFAAAYWGPPWLQTWLGYVVAWLLLTSEIAGLATITVSRLRGTNGALADDAEQLATKTHVPAPVWIVAWFALICWAIWKGLGLLWP